LILVIKLNNNVDYTLIGTRIKQRRLCMGLTQEKVSEAAGITTVYLSKIENGRVSATLETLGKVCKILEIELGYIVSGCHCEGNTYGNETVLELYRACSPEIRPAALKILRELARIRPGND